MFPAAIPGPMMRAIEAGPRVLNRDPSNITSITCDDNDLAREPPLCRGGLARGIRSLCNHVHNADASTIPSMALVRSRVTA